MGFWRASLVSSLAFLSACGGRAALSQPPNSAETSAAVSAGSPVAVSAVLGERDSADGIDVAMTWKNLSRDRALKYCWFTVDFVNSVGDTVTSRIGNKTEVSLQATGPYRPGQVVWGGNTGWSRVFYSPDASKIRVKAVACEYQDGQKTSAVTLAGVAGAVVPRLR